MAYILRGVPHTFQTESQVLSFLRHSPGYMQRQEAYLKRFWPGLYSKVQPAKPARIAGGPKKSKGLLSSVADIAGDVGTAVGTTFAEAALGGRAPQRGPVRTPPVVAGALAGAGGASKAAIDVAAGPETRKVISGLPASKVGLGIEAASILPLGKAGKLGRLLKGAKAAEAERVAREVAPETAAAIQKARKGLEGASDLYKEQQALRKAERVKRGARIEGAMEQGGVEGLAAASQAAKGEMPRLSFKGFEDITPDDYGRLIDEIWSHPSLEGLTMRKYGVAKSLEEVMQGKTPTPSEMVHFNKIFGKELTQQLTDPANVSKWKKAGDLGLDILNIPRTLMATLDFSAPFRQGLVLGARHPVIFAKNIVPMIKYAGPERFYKAAMEQIVNHPNYERFLQDGGYLTDLGNKLERREEQFASRLIGKLPGIKQSSQAYTGFLNKLRFDAYNEQMRLAEKAHYFDGMTRAEVDHARKSLVTFINSASGRGDMGSFERSANILNATFFSPRLMASRFNFLSPFYYGKLDKRARVQAMRAALQTTGFVGGLLALAATALGVRVGHDPRNADFGKMRFGNTRVDIAAGFQQPLRLIAQLGAGKVISSTTGKELTLGPQGPGKLSRRDIIERFFENKLSPFASVLNDAAKGSTFMGKPFNVGDEAKSHMIPLLAQDAYEIYKEEGGGPDAMAKAMGAYGIGMWGFGFQTYPDAKKDDPKYAKSKGNPYRSKSSGNPYRKRSSSGNPYR